MHYMVMTGDRLFQVTEPVSYTHLREGMEAPEDKISAIEKYLADYKHEVEMRGGVDGSKVDSIPAKDQASTLFEGPSEAEVVSKMLNPFSKER